MMERRRKYTPSHSLFVNVIYSSSDELVKERYAVQAIPITDTNG